jgi:hypothetical protein
MMQFTHHWTLHTLDGGFGSGQFKDAVHTSLHCTPLMAAPAQVNSRMQSTYAHAYAHAHANEDCILMAASAQDNSSMQLHTTTRDTGRGATHR